MKKTYFWIILIVLVLVYLYYQLKYFADKIDFGYDIKSIDLSKINFSDLKKGQAYTTITVNAYIINNTQFDLNFNDLKIDMYYNGQLVAKTSEDNAFKKVSLVAGKKTEFIQKVDVLINQNTFGLLYKIKTNVPYIIEYKIRVKSLGMNLTYKDSYNSQS